MAARTAPTRQDTFAIRVHLNGEAMGIFDKKSGGEVDSDTVLYYPGAMGAPISLGGRRTTGNVTLQREYDRIDDHGQINKWIRAAGRAKVDVAVRPMDIDANEFGKALNYTGTLKRVSFPDVDSESTSAALLEIEVVINGFPSTI